MATLAANPEWYERSGNIVQRQNITEVEVTNGYTQTGNEVASWDASASMDGSIMCHIVGTKLTIVCDSFTEIPAQMFFQFLSLETISGLSNVTAIGERAFCYTPKISAIDIDPAKLTSIGAHAFRMSSAEDYLDLSKVSLDIVGDMATRHKRWSAEGLAAVQAVTFPRSIFLDVPNCCRQSNYTDIPFYTDGETIYSVAEGGCTSLAMYHMWNAIYAGTEKEYTDYRAWFDEKLNNDGDYPVAFTTTFESEQATRVGWGLTINGQASDENNDYNTSANQLTYIVNELEKGLPVGASMYSVNEIGRFHAIAIIGCDASNHKLAIIDSNVVGDTGTISWVAYEDIFVEGWGTGNKDSIRRFDFNQPVLATGSSWFTQGGTSATRESITEVEIVRSYTPSGSETASWDASAKQDGSVMAYANGTKLTLAGNGDIQIWTHPNASCLFSDTGSDMFSNLVTISGAELLNTRRAQTIARMFSQAAKLTTVDVSNWDTCHIENMEGVFDRAKALRVADVSNWDTSSCTTMMAMFQCALSITILDLSKWDVSKVTNMNNMFAGQNSSNPMALITIGDISKWDTGAVEHMQGMFSQCAALERLDVRNWDVSKVLEMNLAFRSCKAIQRLDLSSWDVSNATNITYMFYDMPRLEKITVGSNFAFTVNGTSAGLPTPSADYIPHADGNWYDFEGNAYAPTAIPSGVARTYYASKFLAADDDDNMVFIRNGTLRKLAVAIRHKSGKTDEIYPPAFADEVLAI